MSAPIRMMRRVRHRVDDAIRGEFVGRHPAMLRLLELIARAARLDTPVLIQGPTGSGKELVAERLHACSGRPGRLVALNVANLPDDLAESELFGSTRGAFTGANRDRGGLIDEAAGGTLYLDEATELSPALQAKLLRVLETGAVRPVGETRDHRVSFRLVLSTQLSVTSLVKEGRWRSDFYYRVAGVSLEVPALAEHASDIPLLLDHFLGLLGRDPLGLEAAGVLADYPWHGNVRELKRVVERASFVAADRSVSLEDIMDAVAALQVPRHSDSGERRMKARSLRDMERDHIAMVLCETNGDTIAAAVILGLSRSQLYRRIQELGIHPVNQP